MDSVSSETVDSSSAVNEEKPADSLYVGRESLQVRFTAGTYANYHGPFESIVPFLQGVREF